MKIQTHFTYEGVKCIQQLNNPLTSMEFFMLKLKEKKKKVFLRDVQKLEIGQYSQPLFWINREG